MAGKRHFGSIRRLPSGRYQARYTGPDGVDHTARDEAGRLMTFDTAGDADAWLGGISRDIQRGRWNPPGMQMHEMAASVAPPPAQTLSGYANAWLATRKNSDGSDLSPGTKRLYRQVLNSNVMPELGGMRLDEITTQTVRAVVRAAGHGAAGKVSCLHAAVHDP